MGNRKLTEAQKVFVEKKMEGCTDNAAAIAAGQPHATGLTRSEVVRAELAAARRWLTDATQIRRLDIVEGIIDGIEIARHLGDAGNVIKGWVEVGKILGHCTPEVRVQNMTINQMHVRSKFESMSLEDLLAISEGRAPALSAPSERVN